MNTKQLQYRPPTSCGGDLCTLETVLADDQWRPAEGSALLAFIASPASWQVGLLTHEGTLSGRDGPIDASGAFDVRIVRRTEVAHEELRWLAEPASGSPLVGRAVAVHLQDAGDGHDQTTAEPTSTHFVATSGRHYRCWGTLEEGSAPQSDGYAWHDLVSRRVGRIPVPLAAGDAIPERGAVALLEAVEMIEFDQRSGQARVIDEIILGLRAVEDVSERPTGTKQEAGDVN